MDYIEERNGKLDAFEFKFSDNKRARLPLTFAKAYPDHTFNVYTSTNYVEFIQKIETP